MSDASENNEGFSAPPAQLDLPSLEGEILGLWAANEVEARSLQASDRPAFVFYDGPPFATGLPHYGHLLAGTIKDVVPRYWFMRGFAVERRFGWDCHGLPIESLVEEELGVHGKAEIEAYGVPEFNAACRQGVLRYTAQWRTTVQRMGRWVDFDNDYKTMDPTFMESVWWVFKQLWDKDLVYEGYRVQPVSPALGTPLSNFEVAQGPQEKDPVTKKDGHRRVQDPSLTVRFALEDEENAFLWAWTTTPWTLPSNLALAVHPEVEYVKVRVDDTGEIAYVEPGRLADYQARERIGKTTELDRLPGRALVGRPYTPLLPYFADLATREDGTRGGFFVVEADYVTTDSGTGIVHQAPAFGEDDFRVGQENGLALVRPLGLDGRFTSEVPDFEGQFAKDADKGIIARLKAEGKVVDQDTLVHAYPHCYRTDEPLLYMALSTWFMSVEPMRERLVALNDQIHWVPEHVGKKRFGNWLEGARDWNLSRNRYWGTPLPIWRCDLDPSELVCIGSRHELESLAGLEPGSLEDIHRESVDDITFPSQNTEGGTMRRIQEVFDCWFESGSMPYAQNHYPFENREYVEQNLPANFIAEGLDQTRGWFYTLHVLSVALFDRPAFEHCIVNGLLLAADGKKMSKRLKNYPDPSLIIDTYGADALRAYLISGPAVRAEPMRFGKHKNDTDGEGVRDMVRTAILPLWNAYNFLVTYARADGWSPSEHAEALTKPPQALLDRWILSRAQSFVGQIGSEFEAYRLYNLVPSFLELCDDLNNWYIRRGRRRYWRGVEEDPADKARAYETLYRVIVLAARAIAPVLPFFSDFLYQRLVVDPKMAATGEDSVHLCPFPQIDRDLVDEALEAQVALARKVVAQGLTLREQVRMGVRRPLRSLTVASPDESVRAAVVRFADEIAAELNVKGIEVVADDADLVTLSAKANFKVLGRRLGKRMKVVARAVEELGPEILRAVSEGGQVEVEGETLGADDLILQREPLPGRVVSSSDGVTVVLDTNLDEALVHEGLVREVVNRVQNLRKASGLEVSDRIRLRVKCGPTLASALDQLGDMLAAETLAVEHTHGDALQPFTHQAEDEIDDEGLVVSLERVEVNS